MEFSAEFFKGSVGSHYCALNFLLSHLRFLLVTNLLTIALVFSVHGLSNGPASAGTDVFLSGCSAGA